MIYNSDTFSEETSNSYGPYNSIYVRHPLYFLCVLLNLKVNNIRQKNLVILKILIKRILQKKSSQFSMENDLPI